MIAAIKYKCIGSEVNDGINTEVYFHGASGYQIIDTIVKGVSKRLTVDENTGLVLVDEVLVRGDEVLCIYKTLPRFATDREFSPINFDSSEFA
jgi:hypothetical protein